MSWNNRSERAKFEAIQKKHYEEYLKQGMTEEQIKNMYEFDLEQFNSNRRYYMHAQSVLPEDFDDNDDNEDKLSIFEKFRDVLTVSIENSSEFSRYWWIEEIDNPILATNIKKLTPDDLELLTKYIVDGVKQTDLSVYYGITQKNICKKISRIMNFLKTGV